MDTVKKKLRTTKGVREYSYLGCPLTRNKAAWCHRLCKPDVKGKGRCGRVAPHSLTGRTAQSIAAFKKGKREEHFKKLECLYLETRGNQSFEPGIQISEGEAEIVFPIREDFCHPQGPVHGPVCFKAMNDSALYAVNSIVDDVLVLTESFNIYLSHPVASGELIARSRYISILGNRYLAESVIVDSDRNEIGRGSGAFVKSDIPLLPEIGYR